jgi:hypothetical protein
VKTLSSLLRQISPFTRRYEMTELLLVALIVFFVS